MRPGVALAPVLLLSGVLPAALASDASAPSDDDSLQALRFDDPGQSLSEVATRAGVFRERLRECGGFAGADGTPGATTDCARKDAGYKTWLFHGFVAPRQTRCGQTFAIGTTVSPIPGFCFVGTLRSEIRPGPWIYECNIWALGPIAGQALLTNWAYGYNPTYRYDCTDAGRPPPAGTPFTQTCSSDLRVDPTGDYGGPSWAVNVGPVEGFGEWRCVVAHD